MTREVEIIRMPAVTDRHNGTEVGGTPVLEVSDLEFDYGITPVLRGVSFRIMRGELVALLGPNGAGKTTTLRLIAGLESYQHGRIVIAGQDRAANGQHARSLISYLPDEPQLYDLLSPLEFLEFVGALRELPADYVANRSLRLMEIVGVADAAERRIGLLSRGMRQRVALAGALLGDPELLVMDEPFTGLDPVSARQVRNLLKELVANGLSVLMSTHQLHFAEQLAGRVLVMSAGKIISDSTPTELRALDPTSANSLEDGFLSVVGVEETQ